MKYLVLALLFIIPSLCVLGVDVSQLLSTSTYLCMRNSGYTFAVIRGYLQSGTVDPNLQSNIRNANSFLSLSDIYMVPCRGKSASAQVDQLINAIPGYMYGMVWIQVQTNPSAGCGWGTGYSNNCNFLIEAINRIKSHGKVPGIYTTRYMWQTIMGGTTACPGAASQPLWYVNPNNSPSFNDFQAFGGWTTPKRKQFQSNTSLCGGPVNKDFSV